MNLNLKTIPTLADMALNIQEVFLLARPEQITQGITWYDVALEFCEGLSTKDYPTKAIAGVTSCISPKLSWPMNMVCVPLVIDYHRKGVSVERWPGLNGRGMFAQMKARRNCYRMLAGEDPEEILGMKTRSFYRNIMGDAQEVTIDRWAIRVATGQGKEVDKATIAARKMMQRGYRLAAERCNLAPRDLQAVTWVVQRSSA